MPVSYKKKNLTNWNEANMMNFWALVVVELNFHFISCFFVSLSLLGISGLPSLFFLNFVFLLPFFLHFLELAILCFQGEMKAV